MTAIGFIGLGVMGQPMAQHLVRAGHEVSVHNRSPEPVQALVAEGARAGASAAEVAANADVVITMVPDSPDVEDVVLGEDGVLSTARQGLLLIDMSTVRPDTARLVGDQAQARGVRFLDAPVSGGEVGAVEATLSIMVGGSAEDFEAALPILGSLGKTIVHVGPIGSGQTVKAANQLIVAGVIELVSEAIVLLEAHGVDMQPAIKVLAGGLAGNQILERKAANMLARKFDPGFRIDLHHKDMQIVQAAARDAGVAIPVTALVAQMLVSLRSLDRGSLDHSAILTLIEDLSGRGDSRPTTG
ncbi:MAG TPA: 2-hydroxy-3-oxopropionate reductase [Actinomycetota bacterium]|nr:2-hydroxy-3-oxopropionate reductase [Actinomycetota bacterium]